MIRAVVSVFFAALAIASAAHAQIPGARQHVDAELVSSRVSVAPGERFVVALRQVIDPGWHTYWVNPGDSGIATTIAWDLPKGFAAGPIEWPTPETIEIEGLVNYGYSGEVIFPVEVTAPTSLGPTTLRARVDWLACEDVCIPESADLVLNLNVGGTLRPDETWAPRLSAARAALPQPADLDAEALFYLANGASLPGAKVR